MGSVCVESITKEQILPIHFKKKCQKLLLYQLAFSSKIMSFSLAFVLTKWEKVSVLLRNFVKAIDQLLNLLSNFELAIQLWTIWHLLDIVQQFKDYSCYFKQIFYVFFVQYACVFSIASLPPPLPFYLLPFSFKNDFAATSNGWQINRLKWNLAN